MRKIIGPLLTVVLAAGVFTAIYFSMRDQLGTVTVTGLIGSEKYTFFQDPKVIDALRSDGLVVNVRKAGSRQIAVKYNLKEYDFAFPAGVPAAEKIRQEQKIRKSYSVFFTPMVVASWRPIAEVLEANGIVEKRNGIYFIVKLGELFKLIAAKKRWNELHDNSGFNVNKGILVTSTDIRKSNSAAMYMALASYVLNGSNIVANDSQIDTIMPALESLFMRQGFLESSSAAPFNDYMVMGIGKAPLVMIYEAQFLYEAARDQGGVRDRMVLLYPEPTIFTKHTLLVMTEGGEKLGEALTTDPVLKKLAVEHGLRNDEVAAFRAFTKEHKLAVPESLVNVIEPPSYEIIEKMITTIEAKYQSQR